MCSKATMGRKKSRKAANVVKKVSFAAEEVKKVRSEFEVAEAAQMKATLDWILGEGREKNKEDQKEEQSKKRRRNRREAQRRRRWRKSELRKSELREKIANQNEQNASRQLLCRIYAKAVAKIELGSMNVAGPHVGKHSFNRETCFFSKT